MHTHAKSLQKWMLCIAVVLSAVFCVSTAHAAYRVNFTLTAVVDGTSEEIRPGIFETKPTLIRITNKELLANYLSLAYPSAATPGARLGMATGEFVILDSTGAVLDMVSDTVLYLGVSGNPVQNGTENTVTSSFGGNVSGMGAVEFAADGANHFEIVGPLQGQIRPKPMLSDWVFSYLLKLSGDGSIGGVNSFVFGTVKWRSAEF